MPFAPHEIAAMRRALELAARGGRATSPNPQVGCVLLDADGRFVAEGWHRRAGGPHAEVEALRNAGEVARGGTAVVTLEPCDHTGRTGPCTEALLHAGIRRVVYAAADPTDHVVVPDVNPAEMRPVAAGDVVGTGGDAESAALPSDVAGLTTGVAGARTLAAAGIEVVGGLNSEEAIALNREWFVATRRGRPYVSYKYAATLDGRVAAADGSSRWITSAEARADVHRLRAEADAVLVGSGTAAADDPQLAVRDNPAAIQPLRVVLDTEASAVRPGARVLDDAAPTLLAIAEDLPCSALDHLDRPGRAHQPGQTTRPAQVVGPDQVDQWSHGDQLDGRVRVLRLPRAATGGLRAEALLAELYRRGVVRLLLEGGPTLAGSLLRSGLVDRIHAYLAPILLGAGPAALGDAGVRRLADAHRLRIVESVLLGPDIRITADVLPEPYPTVAPDPDR